MYQYVLSYTCTVHGGTRRYKAVQGGTWRYNERYTEVHDSMRIVLIVRTGTYWHVLIAGVMVQPGPGYAALRLDSLLRIQKIIDRNYGIST
jgi:hypothetical protein